MLEGKCFIFMYTTRNILILCWKVSVISLCTPQETSKMNNKKNICNSNSQVYLDNILLISEVHANYQLLGDCIAAINKLYK